MTAVQFDPFTPESIADPFPTYKLLREHDPIHYSELLDGWVLTRYDDIVTVLKHPRFSAARAHRRTAEQLEQPGTMLSSDPPEHTRLRGLAGKAFTSPLAEAMGTRIQHIVDELLDAVQASGRMDLIHDLAYPLPAIVIAELLGIPAEQLDSFKRWSDDIIATLGGLLVPPEVHERGTQSAQELADYFHTIIGERRREPRGDLLSQLVAADERDASNEQELIATCMLLLAAGHETTTNLIGNGMLDLFRNPSQLERLKSDLTLVDSAVEELLRYSGPVHAIARVATETIAVGGRSFEAGQLAFCLIAAANRDPAQFDAPEVLDVARRDNKHIAFGMGIHFCLGAALARIEARIALRSLLERMPDLHLASDDYEWNANFILRGLKRLPVAW
jgi:cytochrome P450